MGVKKGDIFVSSWGYDQTNYDFYRVEKVSASGKTVTLIRLENEMLEYSSKYMSSKVIPGKKTRGKPFRRRLFDNGFGPGVKIESYAYARLWDGGVRTATHYA